MFIVVSMITPTSVPLWDVICLVLLILEPLLLIVVFVIQYNTRVRFVQRFFQYKDVCKANSQKAVYYP
jgi:hypothetical protein